MEQDLVGFKVDYEADSGKSYVVLSRERLSSIQIVDFQVEMIAKSKIPGVVSLCLRELDMEIKLYYDVTGLISLNNFLRRNKIKKDKFLQILENIASALTQSKRYLLTDRCFVLNESLIYINPQNLNTYLIYIPVENKSDVLCSFKGLVRNLVINTANIETSDNFVQAVLNLTKLDNLNLVDLLKQLKSLCNNNTGKISDTGKSEINHEEIQPEPVTILPLDASCAVPENKQDAKTGISRAHVIGLTGVIVLLLAGGWTYLRNNPGFYRIQWNSPPYAKGAGLGLIIAILGILVFMRLRGEIFGRGKGEVAASRQTELKTVSQIPSGNPLMILPDPKGRDKLQVFNTGVNSDETVVLSEISRPMLIAADGENIFISTSDFVIGRNREMCDHAIQNKGVGRAHARITSRTGKFYITDLDSKNGTFINGAKLISNKEYEMKINDKVHFANLEFTFNLGEGV